eukprot:TRINITY_DN3307_c0_g1_i2.p3 TRINITY_DN3307_c0_g1~~TRINITY_DN3307_c0_g1_i2.p3  ORF type:complete len:105 (+),score=33.91 TRINITY_DN3307_c0_g1_i2:63-377(+)
MAFAGKHRGSTVHDRPLVDRERCRPSRCAKECQKICPQERQGVESVASAPTAAGAGLESFLRGLGITVRRDPDINKRGSVRDREQRAAGQYFDAECQRREHHQC